MHGYRQLPFWILIHVALAKICFFHIVISKFLKKLEYLGPLTRDAQNICAVAKRHHP